MFRFVLATVLAAGGLPHAVLAAGGLPHVSPARISFHQPLLFEPNRGQVDAHTTWIAHGSGYRLAFQNDGVTMLFRDSSSARLDSSFKMALCDGTSWNHIDGLERAEGVSNYLDRKPPVLHVPQYKRLGVKGVYAGIDLAFYNHQDALEYDFIVAPGADPGRIAMAFEGARDMQLEGGAGALLFTTNSGAKIRLGNPSVYQQVGGQRKVVAASYRMLAKNRVTFAITGYDHSRPLIIDPVLTLVQLVNAATAQALAVDADGNSYITGAAESGFQPTDDSQFFNRRRGLTDWRIPSTDGFVTKLSPTGQVLFSTFICVGEGSAIAVDGTGIYVAGTAEDPEETPSPIVTLYGGGENLFAFRLSLTGDEYFYRYVLAGNDIDRGTGIALDASHNAWVVGYSVSTDITKRRTFDVQALLIKIDANGVERSLQSFGGADTEYANGVTLDSSGNPYVTGETCSKDFPATPGFNNLRTQCGVFVVAFTKGSPATIRYATVFAGSKFPGDAGNAITVNAQGEAYVAGTTTGPDFPVQPGAYQIYPAGLGLQAFVMKLDSTGRYLHSTLLGAGGDTSGLAIALNGAGEVFLSGNTTSTNFPGNGPMYLGPDGMAGYFSKFTADLGGLLYSRQIGASASGIKIKEAIPAVTPAEIYVTGFQTILNSPHTLLDRLTDDSQLNRIRNYWKQDQYINTESGTAQTSQVGPGWLSAQWDFEMQPTTNGDPVGAKAYYIRNRWHPDQYLNVESGSLQSSVIGPGWLSARWVFEPVAYNSNLYRIRNIFRGDQCLNIENGVLTASPVESGWWSAWWTIEHVY